MLTKATAFMAAICLLITVTPLRADSRSLEVEALFENAAVLMINGQRKMLRVGQSFDGVTVVVADPASATVEFDGRTEEVGLSKRITSNFQVLQERRHTIARDANRQYLTNAIINGRRVQVLVDTGANVVALSAAQANSLGIDFNAGEPSRVETASGITSAYSITLQSVSVGGIKIENVQATVVAGDYPTTVLLGMSYLQHVKIQEHNGILSLTGTP
jgi:aspartyl protease family protein